MLDYPIYIVRHRDGEQYCAYVPDLPGCLAVGPSRQAAAEAIDRAITAYLEAAKARGESVPEPGTDAKAKERMRSDLATVRNNLEILEARLDQILSISH
jgi:predicted RNase H-like HicB family nuclease